MTGGKFETGRQRVEKSAGVDVLQDCLPFPSVAVSNRNNGVTWGDTSGRLKPPVDLSLGRSDSWWAIIVTTYLTRQDGGTR